MILHFFTLAFVILKLTGVIGWSWWLVLLPSYGFLAVALVIWLVAAIIVIKNGG
jgi:hypothetical protein